MNIINDMLVDKCFPDNANARAVVPAYKEKTTSGNPITLTDSAEWKPLNMKLYGWSKQDGEPSPDNPVEIESAGMKWSTGKNLVNLDAIKSVGWAKSVSVPEPMTKLSNYVYRISMKFDLIDKKDNFQKTDVAGFGLFDADRKVLAYIVTHWNDNKTVSLHVKIPNTFDWSKVSEIIIYGCGNDQVASTGYANFYDFQIEKGTEVTAYEPYTGGVPKPYGDKVGVSVHGKNLFDESLLDDASNYDMSLQSIGFWKLAIPVKNKPVTVSIKNTTNSGGYLMVNTTGTNGGIWMAHQSVINLKRTATLTPTDGFIYLMMSKSIDANKKTLQEVGYIQIEYGTEATTYEPYRTPQSTSIITPNGLPGIPVPSNTVGITYTDADGQAWIADYIDFKHGKYIQNVRIKELTGQESYIVAGTSYFSGSSANMYINVPDMIRDGEVMCNCLSKKPYVWTVKSAVGFATNLQQIHLRFPKAIIGVNDDAVFEDVKIAYKKYIKTLYDNGKPVVVQYILANSIERDLTSAELAEYIQLYSYKPTTVMENDSDCWMDVTYKAGTSGKSKNEALRWYFKNVMPLVE